MRLESPSGREMVVVREVHVRSAVQQYSIGSALPGTEPESVGCYMYSDTEGSKTFCTILDWAIFFTLLF